jgi:hypothetical protein
LCVNYLGKHHIIVDNHINIVLRNNSRKMALAKVRFYEGFRLDLAQTKRMHHPPSMWGDNNVLTWSILTAQAMVGAKVTQHHDGGEE